ncbi:MAG: cyclic pyranopterin monophosphate synthase MoaC [Propionibacterium sp.]|nr:cyclic pyranopterin monophosphate synthase MoaC [Propionibacterium sp.]
MVDVAAKGVTLREASASGLVRMSPATLAQVTGAGTHKGNVLEVARLAGIMAAKRTGELIPLCHPIGLDGAEIDFAAVGETGLSITSRVRTTGRTGVEMEALTAVAVAALTVIDMVKSVDRGVEIEGVRLDSKSGGQSGNWRRSDLPTDAATSERDQVPPGGSDSPAHGTKDRGNESG